VNKLYKMLSKNSKSALAQDCGVFHNGLTAQFTLLKASVLPSVLVCALLFTEAV